MSKDDDDRQQTQKEFSDAVNMTASEIETWLKEDESKSVGQKSDGDASPPATPADATS